MQTLEPSLRTELTVLENWLHVPGMLHDTYPRHV